MFTWEEPTPRATIFQLNAELSHAELELSSVELTLRALLKRFSSDEIKLHARTDLVQKSLDKLTSLHSFYLSMKQAHQKGRESADKSLQAFKSPLNEDDIRSGITYLAEYLQERREHYLFASKPIQDAQAEQMKPFFSARLLKKVRLVEMAGRNIPDPPFYAVAEAAGVTKLPELRHMNSLTFVDVIVFPERATVRDLFHGLVHAVQFDVLGLARYTELFVHSFLERYRHFLVPLETHACELDAKYASNAAESFSVEEQVWRWIKEGRYAQTVSPPAEC